MDSRLISGAMRDTVLITPRQTVKAPFDAADPGYWLLHCHMLYHQAAGVMTVLKYTGFQDDGDNPLASRAVYER